MEIRQLAVPHAFEFTPVAHMDDRGVFLESYRADLLEEATGRRFELRQANVSVSRKGVARGVHFADVPAGQAKYVSVPVGSVIDYVIDLRAGSPTFGATDAVELSDSNRKSVFLAEGLGHLFVVTSETATVTYLTNDVYRPGHEHSVNPLDPALGIELPKIVISQSPRDEIAPTLAEALAAGLLPAWADCLDVYAASAVGAQR